MVSPLTARLKSVIDAAALKTGPALEKSSELTSGLTRTLSMMSTSGPADVFIVSTSDAFAAALGRSPWIVMLLPLRVIDKGANDNTGITGAFAGPGGALNVGNAPVGPLTLDRSR